MSLIKSNTAGLGGSGSPGGALGSFFSQTINQSLRLDHASGAYLEIAAAPPTPTNLKKTTISCWVKRSTIGTEVNTVYWATTSGLMLQFFAANSIYIYDNNISFQAYVQTSGVNRLFRDPGAWYHLALIIDTTQSTDADRAKFYVNGELQVLTAYPAQNQDVTWHNQSTQRIGNPNDTTDLAGYIAEFISIDGQDVSISDLGETKDGVWVPKDVSGLTLGNAGYYLPFAQDRTVGASAFFDEDDNSYVAWTDPGNEYEIGASDDYTLEFFFWPTVAEVSGNSYPVGYYRTTGGAGAGYFAVQTALGTRNFYLYHGNGAAYTFGTYASGAVDAGRWHHLAFNRVSGTLRCFLDGAEVGSAQTSNTKTHDIPEFRVNKAHATANTTFDGYISNVRWVVGSAVYSDGSSITVPTSTLTAVTNTKILACTTTTITADASSNNVTGSASGTAGSGYYATDGLSPFPNAAFNEDAGSNGIDFAAKNVFDYDVVPDSPTNNWCTLNYLDSRTSQGWNQGSLNWLASSLTYTAHSTMVIPEISDSDTYYAECRCNSTGYARGISPVTLSGANNSTTVTGMLMLYDNGRRWDGSAYLGSGNNEYATISAGDVFGVKAGNGELRFFQNGNDLGAAFTGLSGSYKFANFAAGSTGTGQTWNFGQDSTFGGLENPGTTTDKNGFGLFHDSEAANNISLCAANIADPTIGPGQGSQADDNFNTVLYTGTGSAQSITGVGFQPDWTWLKGRSASGNHRIYDSVRGATESLLSNSTSAESTLAEGLKSFDSDGFTLGTDTQSNTSGQTYVGWNWKAGGSASSNSNGSITSSVSVNQNAGFSIVSYTGNATDGATVGHGLSQTVEAVIVKRRDATAHWQYLDKNLSSGKVLLFSSTNAETSYSTFSGGGIDNLASTTFSLEDGSSNGDNVNASGGTYIAYCFHSVLGYSKFGSYTGNFNADGPFIYTGFRPAFLIIKRTDSADSWLMRDSKRDTFNVTTQMLNVNANGAEYTDSTLIDFVSNGFKLRHQNSLMNASGGTFIYLAFAEAPFKFANAR